MKKLLCTVVLLMLWVANCASATWTVHGVRDNWLRVVLSGPEHDLWQEFYHLQWDLAWDQLYPEEPDSGIASDATWPTFSGYQDVLTVSTADEGWSETRIDLSGPAPDYSNWIVLNDPLAALLPGEYWIDFDSDGTVRISTTQPADFGKWAWDGSVNPSWAEPLQAKKQHGKGHAK